MENLCAFFVKEWFTFFKVWWQEVGQNFNGTMFVLFLFAMFCMGLLSNKGFVAKSVSTGFRKIHIAAFLLSFGYGFLYCAYCIFLIAHPNLKGWDFLFAFYGKIGISAQITFYLTMFVFFFPTFMIIIGIIASVITNEIKQETAKIRKNVIDIFLWLSFPDETYRNIWLDGISEEKERLGYSEIWVFKQSLISLYSVFTHT